MEKKKIWKGFIPLSVIIFALIVASVLLYPSVADYYNSFRQTRVVARYIDDVAGIDDGAAQAMLAAARAYNEGLLDNGKRFYPTAEETAAYNQLLNTGLGVMGILVIDKLGVNLPIYHGTDEGVLQVGLGHLQGSSLPVGGIGTHAIVTGHRGLPSSTLLTNLDQMAEGDAFALYVMGETLTYQVDNIRTVEPAEVNALAIDREMDYCTLVTCTPYGVNTHRLLVRGHRVETAANPGWKMVYADAKKLGKPAALLIFMLPLLPIVIVYIVLKCRRIRKRGVPR